MINGSRDSDATIIMGGGLTGLTAGYALSSSGYRVKVFERATEVGGLSKTIEHDGFRFDLGGHRFFTKDERIDAFVRDLMADELIGVDRSSKIYMRERFFDYPLKPANALFGMGVYTSMKAVADYAVNKLRCAISEREIVSLEDWVVGNFGRTLFDIYFREYSEKVWGIDCSRISAEWVSKRIKGLSLSTAIKNAFFRFSGKDIPTLADHFLYPELGIGRISEKLREGIEKANDVFTGTTVERINHNGNEIEGIYAVNRESSGVVPGTNFISSIPLPRLVQSLAPKPPEDVLRAASSLGFRDLVIVAIMVDRERVTDQTWIYLPEKKIPFGRIHEPTNWSRKMAPDGSSLLVMEYFSFRGDDIWTKSDPDLVEITVRGLEDLGFIKKSDVTGSRVVRVPKAYPLFEVGYEKACLTIMDYLDRFKNLHISGRSGMFRYYNMDHAIDSGLKTAESVIRSRPAFERTDDDELDIVMAGSGL